MRFTRLLLFVIFALSISNTLYAEGSKNLHPSPNPNANAKRAYIADGSLVYAYAKNGETIYVGSSAQGFGNGRIILTAPNGVVTTTTIGSTTGRIVNRTQELNGPAAITAGGYSAFSVAVTTTTTGIWKIQFVARQTGGDNNNPTYHDPSAAFDNGRNPHIAAFDVTVANGLTAINGRAYMTVIRGNMGSTNFGTGSWWSTLYAQTRDGYRYSVNTNGLDPFGFQFFVNNKGVRRLSGVNGPPAYISANSSSNGSFIASGLDVHNPDLADDVSNVTHKLFFTTPAIDLPTSATVFLTSAVNTWLLVSPVNPVVTNVSLVGLEGQSGFGGTAPLNGGYINFTANQNGSYRIRIDGNNNGIYTDAIDTVLTGTAAAGPNSRYWSGKNGFGAIMASGTPLSVEVVTFAGEVHFPLFDAEENINGLIITRVNGSGSPSNLVFWDDSKFLNRLNSLVVANATTSSPLNATADPGISSAANGHKWGNGSQDIPNTSNGFGNQRLMDTWAYVFSAPITVVTTLVTKESDVEIVSNTNSVNNICVGTDITYTFVARNNGPDNADSAKVSFVTPANLTNLQIISATLTSGTATGFGGVFIGNTFHDTLNTFNNGAVVTYVIKGTISSFPTGGNLVTSARILRPVDITDPDASNPDQAPPTDPVNECNSAPSGAGCNNIKNNSVTVFATPTISVAAAATATQCNTSSFTMAANTPTAGTGLWTIVSGTATITTPTSATTTVTGVPAGTNAVLRWTISNGTCSSSQSTTTITNTAAPTTANAGTNITQCNNGSFTMTANTPTTGTGVWTLVSGAGTITTPSSPTTTVTGVSAGTSTVLRWSITNGICPASSATVTITNQALPTTANAGVDLTNCNSSSFTLAANTPLVGTGLWTVVNGTATITTPTSPTSTVTGVPVGTSATLRWTITNGSCAASVDDVVVTNNNNPTVANAGANQTNCNNNTFVLAGNTPIVGTGLWTIVSGTATITSPTSATSTVTGLTAGNSVTLRWTISNGNCPSSSATVTLTNLIAPNTSNAGTNQTNCNNGNFNISANAAVSGTTGVWSIVSGTAIIANVNNASTTVTGIPAGTSAVLRWSISNGICTSTTSNITLTNNALPTTANAGTGQTLCNATAITLNGNAPIIGTGTWTRISGPNTPTITSPTNATTTVTGLVPGVYVFRWTITNANCLASTSDVTIDNKALVNAGIDRTISCATTVALTAAAGGQIWDVVGGNPATASITNAGAVSGLTAIGTYRFVLSNGVCTDTVNVTRNNCPPVATQATNSGNEDNPISGSLASNGSDFDNDALTFSTATAPKNGSIVINADGTYTYTPNSNFNGNDTVFFRVCDASNVCVTQRLILTVNPVNDAPIAVNDNNTTRRDVPVSGTVRTNDSDIENSTLTVQTTPTLNPVNGNVVISSNGNYTYTPNQGFIGVDSFKYTICDPGPLCSVATVYINVTPGIIDLVLTKTATPKPVVAGNTLTYTITVRNNGTSTINSTEKFIVRDDIPVGFTPTTYTPSGGTYNAATGEWTGISLAPNASATLTIVGTVNASYSLVNITNNVSAIPPVGTTDPTPATATDVTTVSKAASITVTKVSSGNTFVPGTSQVYTITAVNNGPSDVIGATIVDNLPVGITSTAWTASTNGGATVNTNNGVGAINQTVNIPNGGSVIYTLTIQVPANYTGTSLANTASVTFPSGITNTTPALSTATETDTRRRVYDISVVKTAPNIATAGGNISYNITITNNGPSDLVSAAIADVVPAAITNVTWSVLTQGTATSSASSGTGNNINLTTSIPAGSANLIVITINGRVSPATTGIINNAARVTPTDAAAVNSNTTITEVQTITGLQIIKSGPSTSTVVAGTAITYSIEIINSGPSNAVGASFTDNIPAAIQNVTWRVVTKGAATASIATGTGNSINFTTSIPAGNNNGISVIVTGTVASSQLTDITNTATITPTTGPSSSSQTITTVLNRPSLRLSKAAPATAIAGTPVSFTITATNVGSSDAFNATIADTVNSGITVTSWSASANGTANIIGISSGTGNIVGINGNIPVGTSNNITVTINGIVNSNTTGRVNNTANIVIPGGTPVLSNRTQTTVTSVPSISIVKTGPAQINAGEQISYTLRITNNGPSDAYNVVVRDTIPLDITNLTVTTQTIGAATIGSAGNSGSNRIVGSGLNIPVGNSNAVLITISGLVNSGFTGASITNTAAAQAPNQAPVVSNSVNTNVSITPGLRIAKAGPTSIFAGQRITYTVTVTNSGPSNATNVSIADVVNSSIRNVSWRTAVAGTGTTVTSGATGTGNNIAVSGNVSATSTSKIDIIISGTVDSSFAGIINNSATISGGGSPILTSNTIATTVTKQADLVLTKSGSSLVDAGGNIQYRIIVTNNGPSRANNVTISDIVSSQITNVTWTAAATGNANIVSGATGTGNNVNIIANLANNTTTTNRVTITIRGRVNPASTVTNIQNIATAIPEVGTTDPSLAADTVTTRVRRRNDLRIRKIASSATALNQTITYTLIATNGGPSVSNGFTLIDTIPAAITNVSFTTSTVNNASVLTSTLTGNILRVTGNLGANTNDTLKVIITGILSQTGTITNRSYINTPAGVTERNRASNVSTAVTTVTNQANILIAKSGPATADVKNQIQYRIDVNNGGLSDATGVSIIDTVPESLTNVTWAVVKNTGGTNTSFVTNTATNQNIVNVSANLQGTITGPGSISILVTGTLANNAPSSITNRALATFNGITKTSAVTTSVNNTVDLNIQKNAPTDLAAGSSIQYTIVAANNGPADAVNANIIDTIASNISNIVWTVTTEGGAALSSGSSTGNTNIINLFANIPSGAGNRIIITVSGIVSSASTGSISNTAWIIPGSGQTDPSPAIVTVGTALQQQSNIIINKTGPNTAIAGTNITYTISVVNNGPSDANNVTIADVISTNLTNVSWTATAAGNATIIAGNIGTGNTLSSTVNLPAGTANIVNYTISGTVLPSFTGNISNTATATNGTNVFTSPTITTVITAEPKLIIKKSGPTSIAAGEPINYTIEIVNNGPSDANNISITDVITTNIGSVTWSASTIGNANILTGTTGTANNLAVTGNIAAGTTNKISIVVHGIVNSNFAGSNFNNFALVSGGGSPQVSSDTVVTTVARVADITIQKAGPSAIVAGESIRYSIIVRNNGPSDALGTIISDNIPSTITNVTWNATVFGTATVSATNGTGNTINLTGNIPSGSANYIEIIVNGIVDAATAATSVTNNATATPAVGITDPTPAASTTTATVSRVADLEIVKAGPGSLATNQTINYTLTVVNRGPSNATGITISDIIPSQITGLLFTTSTVGNASVTSSNLTGNNLTVVGNIGSGTDTIKVNITGIVSTSGTFTNIATVSLPGGQTDNNTANNSSSITTTASAQTDLIISKRGPAVVNVNDKITYQIEVTNLGVSDALGAIITDEVSADITNVTWTVEKISGNTGTVFTPIGTQTGNTISVTADIEGTINGPGKLLITITGTVANSAGTSISNMAQLDYAGIKQSAVVTVVNNSADLTIQKNAPSIINAGEKIRYDLVIGNNGPAHASNITITDLVPANITNVTWAATTQGTASVGSTSGSGNNINITGNINAGSANKIIVTIEGIVNPEAAGTLNNTASAVPNPSQVDPSPASASSTTTIFNSVNFRLSKSAPTTSIAGTAISYIITATNFGPSNANNINILDNVPAGITNVSWAASVTGFATIITGLTGTENNISVTGNLPAGIGNTITIQVSGTINANFIGTLNNTANLEYNSAVAAIANTATTVTAQPRLSIVKGGATAAAAGTTIKYSIDVANSGPSNANNITISDAIATQLKNVSWVAVAKGNATVLTGASGTGNSIAVTGNINAGASNGVNILITGTIDSSYSGTINNSATVGGGGSPTITSNIIATTVNLVADVSIVKNAPQNAIAGQPIQYTLFIKNTGPSRVDGLTVNDIVNNNITNVTWTSSASGNATVLTGASGTGNTIAVTGNISNGANDVITITISGIINPSATVATIGNSATVTLPVGYTDPTTGNNTSTISTTINKVADLSIVKSAPANRATNQTITYDLTVVNHGSSAVSGYTISDIVPAGIINIATTTSTTGNATAVASISGNTVTITGNIDANTSDSIKVQITGTISNPGTYTNTATVALPVGVTDQNTNNNSSTVVTIVENNVGVLISKSAPSIVNVKDVITYEIELTNTGLSNANGIIITDIVPASITNVNWNIIKLSGGSNTNFTLNSATNSNTVDLIANLEGTLNGPGALKIIITGTIANNAPGVITNTASAVYNGTYQSAVTSVVNNSVDLEITKSAPTILAAGMPISYSLEVTNFGPADAVNAVIIDTISSNITNVNWSVTTIGGATLASGQAASGIGNIINIVTNIPSGTANGLLVNVSGVVDSNYTGVITNTAHANPSDLQEDPTPTNSTVSTIIINQSNLQIDKSGSSTVAAGNPINYTISVTNLGPSNATGIKLTDIVPAEVMDVNWIATATGNVSIIGTNNGTGNLIELLFDMQAGESNTLTVNITGTANSSFNGNISNTASLVYNGNNIKSTPVNTTITNSPEIKINKTGASQALAGERMTYQLEILNTGPSNSNGLVIADNIPNNLTNVSWVTTTVGNAVVTNGIVGTGNTLNIAANIEGGVGNRIFVTISGIINPSFTGTLTNTATATTPFGKVFTSQTVNTTVASKTNINIKKVGLANVIASGQIQYSIIVGNSGPSNANAVNILDNVPSQIQNVTWVATASNGATVSGGSSISGSGNAINLSATIPSSNNAQVIILVKGIVNQNFSGNITNIASAQNASEPIVRDTVVTIAAQVVDLDIAKVSPSIVLVDNELRYRFVVSNNGPSGANGAVFTDNIPIEISNLNVAIISTTGGAGAITNTITGNTVLLNIGTFPNGSSVVFEIFGTAVADGIITNTATITAPVGVIEPNISNNKAGAMVTNIYPKPKLDIIKTVSPVTGPYYPGQTLTYTLTVRNLGAVTVIPVSVVDSLPRNTKTANVVIGTPTRGTAAYNATTNKINWSIPYLEVTGQVSITYTLRIIDTGAINNTAIVSGPINFAISDTASLNLRSDYLINLKTTKTLQAPAVINVKDKIGFTVEVENLGPNNATQVVVTDELLPNIDDPTNITVSKGTYNYNSLTRTITWNVGNLAVNEKVSMTISTRVISGGFIRNTAVAKGFELEANNNDNSSSVSGPAGDPIPINGDELFIPTVITPNGDGKNDKFRILGIDRFPGSKLTIYNRWGNVVFQSNSYNNEWGGDKLTESTYFYALDLKLANGSIKKYSGWIQLMR